MPQQVPLPFKMINLKIFLPLFLNALWSSISHCIASVHLTVTKRHVSIFRSETTVDFKVTLSSLFIILLFVSQAQSVSWLS
jgi:hypothetical protein